MVDLSQYCETVANGQMSYSHRYGGQTLGVSLSLESQWPRQCPSTTDEMNSLEVKTNKAFIGAAIVLGLFLFPLVILSLVDGIKRGRILFPLVLGVVLLVLFG